MRKLRFMFNENQLVHTANHSGQPCLVIDQLKQMIDYVLRKNEIVDELHFFPQCFVYKNMTEQLGYKKFM